MKTDALSAFIGGPSRFWEFWSIVSPDDILDLPALSISQRHGFPENRVLDQWAQRAANHQLYAPSKELLKISDQASRKPRCCRTGNVDKDVYIAFQRVVPASYRPEKPDIARTVAGGHAQDLVATLSDALRGGHLSILYRQVRVPALCGRARDRPLRFTYRRIRVKGALNDQTDLPHTQRRKRARQTLAEQGFLESGNEVALQPGWARQSRLSGLKSQGGWTVRALAAERNDQNGIDTFAYIAGVERHHQDPMAHRRISQHRGPDLATPGRCVMAGQSPTLERLCSKRLRDRPLARQPWSSGP